MALQFGTKFWEPMKDSVTKLGARYFNPIWALIDARLGALEDSKASYEVEATKFTTIGLQRLDQVLGPSFARLARIAELGFLRATSNTSETLVADEVSTFVIDDLDERELFHASAWVTITKPTSQTDYALAQVLSYNKTNGVLDVMVKQVVGAAGPHADWEIITGTGITVYMQGRADAAAASAAAALASKNTAVTAATQANAAAILIAGGPVSSVNGQAGAVTLTAAHVGAMSAADGVALENEITDTVNDALDASEAMVTAALAANAAADAARAKFNFALAITRP